MKQILYEQEERLSKTMASRSLEPARKKNIGEDGEEISEDDIEDGLSKKPRPQTNAKLPKKQLQSDRPPGKDVQDISAIQELAALHKVILTVLVVLFISLFALMREHYGRWLQKFYRAAIWEVALENLQLGVIVFIGIALYYNNYFDEFLLTSQTQQRYIRKDILLIEIKDYDEMYRINVFAYFLGIGVFAFAIMLLTLCNSLYLDKYTNEYKVHEKGWAKKADISQLYHKQIQELIEKQQRYQQILNIGGENQEMKDDIDAMEQLAAKLEPQLKFLLWKHQFLSRILPYVGPNHLLDSLKYWEYLGRTSALVLVQVSQYALVPSLLTLAFILLLMVQTVFLTIQWTGILAAFLLFYLIIDVNYRMSIVFQDSLVESNFQMLQEEELRAYPRYLEPIFNLEIPKKSVNPQVAQFPFAWPDYFTVMLNFLQKAAVTHFLISTIYLLFWDDKFNIYIRIFIFVLNILVFFSVVYISQRVILQYTITISMYSKNFEVINEIVKDQKFQLYKVASRFYEYVRHAKRLYLDREMLVKENLLMFRPIMEDILKACKHFETHIPQKVTDPREQELQRLGLPALTLIKTASLPKILDRLHAPYSKQDIAFITDFCKDEDPKYLSPNRLILYLHLRHQEVSQNPAQVLVEFLDHLLPQIYGNIRPFEGSNENRYKEENLIGDVDWSQIQSFIQESCKTGFFEESDADILIDCIKRIRPHTITRLAEFIAHQITQMPL